jgi:signal transduction histidine kinase
VVRKWLLPTLSEVLAKAEPTGIDLLIPEFNPPDPRPSANRQELSIKAQSQWHSAISAVETLLLQALPSPLGLSDLSEETVIEGLLMTAPLPLFSHPAIVTQLQTITFTTHHTNRQLPPCKSNPHPDYLQQSHHFPIEILSTDPLADERFCLVLTSHFSLVVVLGEENGIERCQFSFDPDDLNMAWKSLRGRMMLTAPQHLAYLDELVTKFSPIEPNYRWVMAFSQYLLQNQPVANLATPEPTSAPIASELPAKLAADVELLQALTHEIRTPLTTIRTMTRLLLRQPDLSPRVLKRLSAIDRECTEQINRMELIFSAVELATTNQPSQAVDLTTMSISQLLEQSLPHWQQQAERRNLDLAVDIPHQLPSVVSNPTILDRVLTGLVENFTRNLPSGSRIQVEVIPVGDRLKLQLQSRLEDDEHLPTAPAKRHSVGQLLTFQPETGNLSLNLNVTKNLFQLLGGKLIVRQHPQQGEVLTVFLPLSMITTRE